MKNIKARVLAVLMTLVMAIGLLPAGALAEGDLERSANEVIVKEYHLMNRNSFWDYFEKAIYKKASDAWGIVLNGMQIVDKDGASTWRQADVQAGNIYNVYAGRDGSTTDLIQPDEVSHITLYGTYARDWEWWVHSFSVDIPWSEFKAVTHGSQSDTQSYAEVYFSGEEPQPDTIDVTFDLGYTPDEGDRTFVSTIIEGASVKEPFVQRDGYDFLGWFEDSADTAFDFSSAIDTAITLVAKWEQAEEPVQYPYTMSLTYQYSNNGKDTAVSRDVLSETAKSLTLPGVTFTVSDGRIDLRIAKSALDANNGFDYGTFVFETLSNGATLTNKGQGNNTSTSFDANGGALKAPSLLYKEASIAPKLDAWFFIRTDGLVPLETGSTGYPSNEYLPAHDTTGGLPGAVFKENSWSENYGPILGDTISGMKLSEAFATVQDAIAIKPEQSAIDAALAGVKGYDPNTQGVMWYVVKNVDKGNKGCPGYHVDGVLYTKGDDPTQVRVLTYYNNIPDNNKQLAFTTVGLGATATIGGLVPVRDGFDFIGWNTQTDGKGDSYKAGDVITMDDDRALYAQWKLKEVPEPLTTNIEIFHFYVGGSTEDDRVEDTAAEAQLPNGGTVSRSYDGITKNYVNSLNTLNFYKDDLATRNVEYSGYVLYAYDDNGDGGTTPVVWDGSAPLDLTDVKTLRIHLTYYQTRYSVVYKANGGTGTDITKLYNTAAGYTVLNNEGTGNPNFTRTDYTFSGWARGASDGETISAGAPGAALKKGESITYYAQWDITEVPTPITYGVTYAYTGSVPDGMTPPVDGAKYEANTSVTLATAPTAPANYTFSGWTLPGDLTATDGKFQIPNHNVTVTGNWTYTEPPTPATYGVTYAYTGSVPNGMTPPVDGAKYEVNAPVTLAIAPTAPANYTFSGWTLPEGVTATDGKFQMPNHNVTVTGNWIYTSPSGGGGDPTPSRYTVTVNYLEKETGVSIATAFKTGLITSGSRYDVSAEAAKEIDGYTFSSTDGETSGTLRRNLTINAYYTAVVDIPDENPPLGPGTDEGETDIPEEAPPLAPGPDTGNNGGATEDDTVIEEENLPLGNLPQTGTTAQNVNPALTLGLLALAFSMAAAGLTVSLTRKKEEEN